MELRDAGEIDGLGRFDIVRDIAMIVVFVIAQRHFIGGFMSVGIKG